MGRVSPGRVGAARALVAIEAGEPSDRALEATLGGSRDRELGWHLAMGVLRRRGEVDAALRPCLRQPLASMDPGVRAALRVGTFDKLWSRTRAHAAVHQGVEVVRALGLGRAAGLVNAVLRRVARPQADPARVNLPPWLLERWIARYGERAALAWSRAWLEPPPLGVVCDDPAVVQAWREAGLEVRPARAGDRHPAWAWWIAGHRGPIPGLPGWQRAAAWVQDPAAVAVADLCEPAPGRTILDACAAPGGKTMRLARRGARVTAVDRSEARLERLRENLARTGLAAEVRACDWMEGDLGAARFDAVLVDAPCTALGTARRHPEVKWRRQEIDLDEAAARQLAILRAASGHVRPGGALVYAVCSPEPEEGERVMARFLAAESGWVRDAVLHTAPPADGEDAHQAFRLIREGG